MRALSREGRADTGAIEDADGDGGAVGRGCRLRDKKVGAQERFFGGEGRGWVEIFFIRGAEKPVDTMPLLETNGGTKWQKDE